LAYRARTLGGNIRDPGVLARYGGEGFGTLLPGTGAAGATEAAERFLQAIEQQLWPLRPVTASIGVASLTFVTLNAATLVEEADRALYSSKARGRRQTIHYQQIEARQGAEYPGSLHLGVPKGRSENSPAPSVLGKQGTHHSQSWRED